MSSSQRTPYEILGADPGDTQEQLYVAYSRLRELNSPELGAGTRHWEDIETAWKILGDPDRDEAGGDDHHCFHSVPRRR